MVGGCSTTDDVVATAMGSSQNSSPTTQQTTTPPPSTSTSTETPSTSTSTPTPSSIKPKRRIHILDSSPTLLDRLRTTFKPDVDRGALVFHEAKDVLPETGNGPINLSAFPDGGFGAVVAHHLMRRVSTQHRAQTIKELRRVAKRSVLLTYMETARLDATA